ncbi:MAG: elongation factor G [Myxococcota bacterium]|nr:elongation factor G [Myxococcota bacterium]
MSTDLANVRNIGISAHIDSGKTTLTERILYYTGRIHAVHEVRGKDDVGATMDSMALEKERGITIQSAATYAQWGDHRINIIDTPGHVDFTIEVERALRVLDGAVLVLCGVSGVQSQSMTVDRQMRRYDVPRIAFINKLDRSGATPERVVAQLREKLKHNAVLLQHPIGLEADHEGVIDLISMRALYFRGKLGEEVVLAPIPAGLLAAAEAAREEMLDAVSMFSEELMEAILEDKVEEDMIHAAVREGVLSLELTPVYLGSAYKNKGVQALLDAVARYLPSPLDVENRGLQLDDGEQEFVIETDPEQPLVALAFKLDDGRYGQLTYVRIYRGTLRKGDFITNTRTKKRVRVGRLIRMHSDATEDIEAACAGDIVALFGVDCASGDTFTSGEAISMTSMHVPEPVISLSIKPTDQKAQDNMGKALGRFVREDPTFRSWVDHESAETVIAGMGELHLEVYIERMRREYRCPVEVGAPRVAYRECISRKAEFNYVHKKQTGGSGQFACVAGYFEPSSEGDDLEFENKIRGGSIPLDYIPACEKGFRQALEKGRLIGARVTGLRVVLNDGKSHSVDSSDMAFQAAARGAFAETYAKAGPVVLEPLMLLYIEGPSEYQGAYIRTVMQRRGQVSGALEEEGFCRVEAEVPLAEMFGYATELRSASQGKAEFTLEFARYAPVPAEVQKALIEKHLEK